MIRLFPLIKVITWISALYAGCVLAIASVLNASGVSTLSMAFKGAAVLYLVLFVIAARGWRCIWKWVPKLNSWIYPDLNGEWDVEIHWNWENRTGIKPAKAYIKQDLMKFSIELKSDQSESATLIVVAYKDTQSSRPGLYYIYRSEGISGAAEKQDPHKGAAILMLDQSSNDLMHGNYWTDRSTNGQFTLRRTIYGRTADSRQQSATIRRD